MTKGCGKVSESGLICKGANKEGEWICGDCGGKDESFEIISEKEKIWRDALVEAETNYLK